MNYGIVDIITKQEFPDAKKLEKEKVFLSLDEYHEIARKIISKEAERRHKPNLMKLLNNDDAMCNIVNLIAWADWHFDASKGLTRYEYRRQRAYHAICDFNRIEYFKREMDLAPLPDSNIVGELDSCENETLSYLIENSGLTKREKMAINMHRKGYSRKDIAYNIKAQSTQRVSQIFMTAKNKMAKVAAEL